jgi:transaldolase
VLSTLTALANHDQLGSILPPDGGDSEETLAKFAKAGIDIDELASRL